MPDFSKGYWKGMINQQTLSNCIERIIYSKDDEEEENQEIPLGVYIMRGNEIVCVGEIDDELYKSINWETLKGHALKSTKNPLK